jgi:FkbM family methyltransferase
VGLGLEVPPLVSFFLSPSICGSLSAGRTPRLVSRQARVIQRRRQVVEEKRASAIAGRRISPLLGVPLAVIIGLALGFSPPYVFLSAPALYLKVSGRGEDCSWKRAFLYGPDQLRLSAITADVGSRLRLIEKDSSRGLERYETENRSFWIKREGTKVPPRDLLRYLLAEHLWMSAVSPREGVKPGDIVLDCGAHVGTFTNEAIRRGASRVICVEPEPDNAYCLRKNFADEIASGRVVVVEKGVWSSTGTLDLSLSSVNSGMHSFVQAGKGGNLRLHVITIDNLVAELGLPRVDYIKMDIEGAEREALRGGLKTIHTYRPQMMLEMYHLPDDNLVLPEILRFACPDYTRVCGPCERDLYDCERLIPHVAYFGGSGP